MHIFANISLNSLNEKYFRKKVAEKINKLTHRFSTATMVTRKHLSVTLIRTLSVLLTFTYFYACLLDPGIRCLTVRCVINSVQTNHELYCILITIKHANKILHTSYNTVKNNLLTPTSDTLFTIYIYIYTHTHTHTYVCVRNYILSDAFRYTSACHHRELD